jgi:hypothetical protein
MAGNIGRRGVLVLAAALMLAPLPGAAIAPALLLMIKQVAQQAATSMIKDTLLSGLNGLGCKGMALSNALTALEGRGMAGGLGRMTMGLPQAAAIPPDMAAKMTALMPGAGQLPPGMALDPAQMAMLANMQQAMAEPASPAETSATIDELAALGFLPRPIQAELKECMLLVPAAGPALGMGIGMLKPMIPQLRQAREQLRALSPAEQDEVAAAIVQEMKELPADQRSTMLESLDAGFFPARIGAGVRAGLGAR